MIKAVIFDMDGTIIDTTVTHDFPIWKELLGEYGVDLSFLLFQSVLGKKAEEIYKHFIPTITDEQIKQSLDKRYRILAKSLEEKGLDLSPGLIAFLELLKKHDIKTALATGAGKEKVALIAKHFPLQKYFPVIVTSDEVARGKPHPDIFLKATEKLGIKPKDCIVMEDANNGIEAAHKAGMKAIAITTTHKREDLQDADKIIDSFNELTFEDIQSL